MKSYLLLLLLVSCLAFQNCKKDNESSKPSLPASDKLTVTFSNNTIEFNIVDSIKVEFIHKATQHKVVKKMVKGSEGFELPLIELGAGEWEASFTVHTRIIDEQGYRFQLKKDLTLPLTQPAVVAAPTNHMADVWKGFILFTNSEVTALLPKDPSDPNFEIKTVNQNWNYLYIERHIYNRTNTGYVSVDGVAWECYDDCYTQPNTVKNSTAFANFASTINTKTWNESEIMIMLIDDNTGREHHFYLLHEK
ncbi:MAG TPA: hypothetical protein VD794_09340 [Flavisolibacter sp.]|nr:hypothetical protein [Flavisolibacter sp.]